MVNASASSLQAAAVPLSPRVLRPGALALDMMYGAGGRWLHAVGRQSTAQWAAMAWACWSSRRPRLSSCGAAMRPATAPVLAELRQRLRPPADESAAARVGRAALRLLLLVVIGLVGLQLYFVCRIALMAVVDPASTTFQRSEAWRLLVRQGLGPLAPGVGARCARSRPT